MYSRAGILPARLFVCAPVCQCGIDENGNIKFLLNFIKNTCIAVNAALLYNTIEN